jgi:hypothetical protein
LKEREASLQAAAHACGAGEAAVVARRKRHAKAGEAAEAGAGKRVELVRQVEAELRAAEGLQAALAAGGWVSGFNKELLRCL